MKKREIRKFENKSPLKYRAKIFRYRYIVSRE